MSNINRNNYEAFFLDYQEGNLSEDERKAVLEFIAQNPDLKEELEGFELIALKPESEGLDWRNLKKKPLYEDSEELRDQLFCQAIDGELSIEDQKEFNELIVIDSFRKEFELWQNLSLIPKDESFDKSRLYQFGLDLELSEVNFEYFLIARVEGLLDEDQNRKLESYSKLIVGGERQLAIADRLKLQAPKAIIFPDKKALYQKPKKKGAILWMYRAAAVAAIFIFGYFILAKLGPPEKDSFISSINSDTLKVISNTKETDSVKNVILPADSGSLNLPESESTNDEILLDEWEIREPDPVFVAENNGQTKSKEDLPEIKRDKINVDLLTPVEPDLDLAENSQVIHQIDTTILVPIDPSVTDEGYKTIPEITEDYIASKMEIPDEERDRMALNIAKRITDRAAEVLDAEVKKEESKEGDQLTYTFRIGKLKVTRSKNR